MSTSEPDARPPGSDEVVERRERYVTEQVLASFQDAESPRVREVMEALVRHTHAFVREVRLTEREWDAGIDFLARCGHITDERRQEFILLSDVLGVSMLTIAVNQPPEPLATEATVVRPVLRRRLPGGAARGRHRREGQWPALLGRGDGTRPPGPPDPWRPHRGLGGRRRRHVRRAVRRRSNGCLRTSVHRRPRALRLLGRHAHALSHPP